MSGGRSRFLDCASRARNDRKAGSGVDFSASLEMTEGRLEKAGAVEKRGGTKRRGRRDPAALLCWVADVWSGG